MRYYDGRGPLPPDGIRTKPWDGRPSANALRLGRTPTALYRFYSGDGQLLYIGITIDVERRWKQHASSAVWWHLRARHAVEHFPSRAEAETAERAAVRAEKPLYNYVYSAPDSGLKRGYVRPEQRPRQPQPAAVVPEPWRPNDVQEAALLAVRQLADEADRQCPGARQRLREALVTAWDLEIPASVLAAHSKRRVIR